MSIDLPVRPVCRFPNRATPDVGATITGNYPATMDEPRWLTDEQQQAWRRFVTVLFKVPAALEAQLQRDAGLTHMGYLVLSTLSEREDRRLAMSKLAKQATASLPRRSLWVSPLEAQGWAGRKP